MQIPCISWEFGIYNLQYVTEPVPALLACPGKLMATCWETT